MSVAKIFKTFLTNLRIDNDEQINLRYGEITASLNKKFRDTESKTANSLQVGSYGRWTAIKGVSDLDMLYLMPQSEWSNYNQNGGQSKLLTDAKDAIKARYPTSNVRVDRLVVSVVYQNFTVEVQPVFEQDDGSFKYPDTYNGGRWKITKPREEMQAMKEFCEEKNNNLRRLCKMARAWKNQHGVNMGGLLIDTLAHNFLNQTNEYDDKSYLYYDWMSRDFFKYLMEQPNQDHYKALGSGQNVKVKSRFQSKAKKAYEQCLEAITATEDQANAKWRKVYGRTFPAALKAVNESASNQSWRNTEEFIENMYPIDIRYNLFIDCTVSQNGFRTGTLRNFLSQKLKLSPQKNLLFTIESLDVPTPYHVKWKVLNRGTQAQRRDCIRGQIISDDGYKQRSESTEFNGEHIMECYVIKNGVVVARDRIDVPISGGEL